jgi:hypothetical protein
MDMASSHLKKEYYSAEKEELEAIKSFLDTLADKLIFNMEKGFQ